MQHFLRWPVAAALALALGTTHSAPLAACAPEKLDGSGAIDLGKLPGRFIYVDFWASWCGPCKQSFPFMNQLKKNFEAKGVTVVAITVDKNVDDVKDFLKAHKADFTVVRDNGGTCAKELVVKGMPSSYIIDKASGALLYTHKGFRPGDMVAITKQLQQLTEK